MALGRNHRIFNIGNSSGSYGISRVYHDETLSGDGTLSSLLGVVDAGDTEVNEFVYNNSGDIINVNDVVQSNSSNWNDISAYQENSGSFQPSGNYIPYTGYSAVLGYVTNSAFTIHDGSFSNSLNRSTIILSNRITSSNFSNFVAGPTKIEFLNATDSAYVDKDKIHKWDNVSDYTQNNSANWNEVSSKLDASAFDPNDFYPMTGNPSGFLTAVDLTNYYTKNETSGADELANAFANIPAGDEEVNTYVQNNSATINEVNTTYQQNSANYLTAHQSLDGYATTGEVNSVSSILSAAIDANSGNVYTGIDPIVVNNDDKAISANTWAFSAGNGVSFVDDNVNKITRIDVTAAGGNPEVESYVVNNSATIDDVNTTYQTNSGSYLTAHQDISNKLDVSAFSDVSGDFLTTAFGISESATWNDTSNVVQTNSASWTLPSAFVVSADGQAYKSVPNVLTGVTGYYYDFETEYYTKFNNIQNNVQYTLDTHTYEYMSVFTITGNDFYSRHEYKHADYMYGDTHSFTITGYNPSEGDVYVELFTDDYYGGEITLSADGNILKPYTIVDDLSGMSADINTIQTNSGSWDRISALSGYSANGWSVSPTANVEIFAGRRNVSGTNSNLIWLSQSNSGRYTNIGCGEITFYNPSRASEPQIIRPNDIVKWNNYATNKLNVSDFKLSALNDASANNIVLTASLPATPDANTLYLIPEV